MNQTRLIDDIVRRVSEALPSGIREMQHDIEKNVRAALAGAFSRMDLVTREEFDVQTEVLARTRTRLEALEKHIAELERDRLDQPASGKDTYPGEP